MTMHPLVSATAAPKVRTTVHRPRERTLTRKRIAKLLRFLRPSPSRLDVETLLAPATDCEPASSECSRKTCARCYRRRSGPPRLGAGAGRDGAAEREGALGRAKLRDGPEGARGGAVCGELGARAESPP